VHVAAATLFSLTFVQGYCRWRWMYYLYPCAMAVATVYLGEHFVLDATVGILLSLGAWALASKVVAARRTV
jgi:hypothetical protein